MAEAAVDAGEAVEIEQHHGRAGAVPAGTAERQLHPVEIGMAATQAGQRVEQRRPVLPVPATLARQSEADRPLQALDRQLLLVDKVGSAGVNGGEVEVVLAAVAQHDQRRCDAAAQRAAHEAEAVAAIELELDQGDVVLAAQEAHEATLGVRGAVDLEAAAFRAGSSSWTTSASSSQLSTRRTRVGPAGSGQLRRPRVRTGGAANRRTPWAAPSWKPASDGASARPSSWETGSSPLMHSHYPIGHSQR
jgi:hypothetical protein